MRNITRNNVNHRESLTLRFTYFTPSDTPRGPTTTTDADSTNTSMSVRNCSPRLSFSKLRWWKAGAMRTCYLSVICSCCALKEKSTRESTDVTWEVEQPAFERSISLIRSEDRKLLNVRYYSDRKTSRLSRHFRNLDSSESCIGVYDVTSTSRDKGGRLVCSFSYASSRFKNFPLACSTIRIFPAIAGSCAARRQTTEAMG